MAPGGKEYSELLLTPDTSLTVQDAAGGLRTLTVRTPSKAVVIKVSEYHMDDAVRWFKELKRAVQQLQTCYAIVNCTIRNLTH